MKSCLCKNINKNEEIKWVQELESNQRKLVHETNVNPILPAYNKQYMVNHKGADIHLSCSLVDIHWNLRNDHILLLSGTHR